MRRSSGQLAVNHPRYTESIDHRAEASRPKGLLQRHAYFPVLRQRMKYPFCLFDVLELKRNGETFWFFIVIRWSVGAHQDLVVHSQTSMHNLFAPFRWHMLLSRRTGVGDHRF